MATINTLSPARKPKHQAHVWCRQFSRDRLAEISGIGNARRQWLDEAIVAQSAFSRLQIGNTDRWYNVYNSFDGVWQGQDVYFDPTIKPLFIRYAVEVFRQALSDTLEHYPNFTRVEFEDGPLIGERRIIFPDRLDEAATTWLHSRFWQIAEKGNVRVEERFTAAFDHSGCRVGNRVKVRVAIDLDRPETNKTTWQEIRDSLSAGRMPEIDPTPRRCDPKLSIKMLKHLSIPELFALNWEACLPCLTNADLSLLTAAENLDIQGITDSMAAGANPNCFQKKTRQTPLGLIVEQTAHWVGDEGYTEALADEKDMLALDAIDMLIDGGAAVDLAGYGESTPLAEACLHSNKKIITRLLEHGADPSIHCYDDYYIGDSGNAWSSASYRCDRQIDNDDPAAWDALIQFFTPPYEGVWLPEIPESSTDG
jgi:hypothetical protein